MVVRQATHQRPKWYKLFGILHELLYEFKLMPNHFRTIVEIDNGTFTMLETHGTNPQTFHSNSKNTNKKSPWRASHSTEKIIK
jgi:hypothetical protein